jgi:FlaA1/EpsC-like NDP-sugar epimerase
MGKGGEVFLLDMGEPVKIIDLARNMIRLAGFEPDVDIKIEITGMRPGEKLYEELLTDAEGTSRTAHEKIFTARLDDVDDTLLCQQIDHFGTCHTDEEIIGILQEIIPTYHPNHRPGEKAQVAG